MIAFTGSFPVGRTKEQMIDSFITAWVPKNQELAREALLLIIETCEIRVETKEIRSEIQKMREPGKVGLK